MKSIFSKTSTFLFVAILFLASCKDKEVKEDPAERQARREARRAEQKEAIKAELQAETAAKQAAEAATKKAEDKRKTEAEVQKLAAEIKKTEEEADRKTREIARLNKQYTRDKLQADRDSIAAKPGLLGGVNKDKKNIADRSKYQFQVTSNELDQAINGRNALWTRLDELKKAETAAKKKLSDLSK